MSNRVTNTTKTIGDIVFDSTRAGIPPAFTMGPGAVEAQESRGQRELCAAQQLPAEMDAEDRAALERMGIVFLGSSAGDPIFLDVRLPAGWRKEATDHSMWSWLVDEKGRKRARIFYKAAFYDRRARMSVRTRFRINVRYLDLDDYRKVVGYVIDALEEPRDTKDYRVVWRTQELTYASDRAAFDDGAEDKQRVACATWLDANLPQWRNPVAYWDDEPLPVVGEFPPWR